MNFQTAQPPTLERSTFMKIRDSWERLSLATTPTRQLTGAILFLLLFSTPSFADRKLEESLLISTAVSDILITEVAISRGSAEEANPLARSRAARIVLKSASTAFTLYFARKLEPSRWASILRWSSISLWGSAVAWNLSVSF